MSISEVGLWLVAHWDVVIETALSVVAAASAITALTPTPRDDQLIGKIYKGIEWLALNIGRAKEVPPNHAGGRFVAR